MSTKKNEGRAKAFFFLFSEAQAACGGAAVEDVPSNYVGLSNELIAQD